MVAAKSRNPHDPVTRVLSENGENPHWPTDEFHLDYFCDPCSLRILFPAGYIIIDNFKLLHTATWTFEVCLS